MGGRSRRRRTPASGDAGSAPGAPTRPRTAASAAGLAPFAVLLGAAVVWVTGHMNPGVDTWLALASGRHILSHGLTLGDPFSFASLPAGGSWWRPSGWVNQNWLSHAGLAWLAGTFGRDSLVAAKLLLYLAVAAVLVAGARLRGADLRLACVAAAAALACGRDWLELRPAEATNLMAACLLLVVALAGRRPAWLWAAVPLLALWCNLHGGFVFGLGVLGLLALLSAAAWRWPGLRTGAVRWRTALPVAAAAAAVAVVASPFRLSNLTHPLEVSVGPHAAAWRQVSEWRPLLDPTGVGHGAPYLGLLAVAAVLLALWLPGASRRRDTPEAGAGWGSAGARWFDLAVGLVAVAMSFASRRFVPLAAIVLAPLLASWAAEVWQRPGRRFAAPPALRRAGQLVAWACAGGAALAVSRGVAAHYLAPWPADARHASVFDRLTHAYLRPHGPLEFLAANGVAGRILVPWEEGGFVAAAQRPDAASGRPPLQVLIDGRAQEAFPASTLAAYQELVAGGPPGAAVAASGRAPTAAEAAATCAWVERRLDDLGIGLVLVTPASAGSMLAAALFSSPAWQVVYLDEHHSLLASRTLAAPLVVAAETGRAVYPDRQAAALTRAYHGLRRGGREGLDEALRQAVAACEPRPSVRAVGLAVQAGVAARQAELRSWLRQLAERVLAAGPNLQREDGSWQALAAARAALGWLHEDAVRRGDGAIARWAGAALERTGVDEESLRRRVLW